MLISCVKIYVHNIPTEKTQESQSPRIPKTIENHRWTKNSKE
jgi:hypothetical protein